MPETTAIETPNGKPKKSGGSALAKLKARATTDHTGKGGSLRRRRMKITVDKNVCDPGAFDDDFDVVMVSASTDVELDALKTCGDNPAAIMFEMVKQCIVSLDGEPVLLDSRDVVWEALGTAGRSLLVRKWNELCGNMDADALKKANGSTLLLG